MSNFKKTTLYVMYCADILALIVSFILAYVIKFRVIEQGYVSPIVDDYLLLVMLIVITYILINLLFVKNNDFIMRSITQELVASFKMDVYIAVFVLVSLFFMKNGAQYSRIQMTIFIVLSFPVLFLSRIFVKKWLRIKQMKGRYQEKVLVISQKNDIDKVMLHLKSSTNWDINVTGIALIDVDERGAIYDGVEVLAGKDQLLQIAQEIELDSVFVAMDDLSYEITKDIVDTFQSIGKNVHIRIPEYELCDGYKSLRKFGDFAAVSYLAVENMVFYQVVLRRFVEMIIGLLGCILAIFVLPLMFIGSIESPGKLIGTYVHIGKNGRRYYQYHYRVFRMDADERIKSGRSPFMLVGKLAYKLHIDKLPGSYNVLCGDIGLIGIESPTLVDYLEYSASKKRGLRVKPGIIGNWSYRKISDESAATLEYEEDYEKTLLKDIKIFVMAIGRAIVYHPKRILTEQDIKEQLVTIDSILNYRKLYEYDYSTYQEKKNFKRYLYLFVKRTGDIIISLIALIILSPLFLTLSMFVSSDDGGSPFYGHVRIGKHGKKVRIYKFRSMKNINIDIEKILTPEQLQQYKTEFKIDNDPRITNIGNYLRKSSLDELPQLLNILKGDISIVGPRPIVEKEIQIYGKDQAKLLSVKPGLTGYWQAYARNNATYESGERQKMEMYYVDHQSLWLDMKILFKTVQSVLKGNGAQ